MLAVILAVGGPPNSGKSVLITSLYKALNQVDPSFSFLQRACPDGEGMWFQECPPDLQKQLILKGSFTEDFINSIVDWVRKLDTVFSLVLLDLGGKPSDENKFLLENSDCLLIVTSDESKASEWRKLACEARCCIVGTIVTSLDKGESYLRVDDSGTISGTIYGLEREKGREPYWDTVVALGDFFRDSCSRDLFGDRGRRYPQMESTGKTSAQKPVFYLLEKDDHKLLYFEIPGPEGITSPPLFAESVQNLELASDKGLVISGKGPIWGYGMILHKAHATPWVAFADPRLQGAVVVESHDTAYSPGDIYPFEWKEIEEAKNFKLQL